MAVEILERPIIFSDPLSSIVPDETSVSHDECGEPCVFCSMQVTGDETTEDSKCKLKKGHKGKHQCKKKPSVHRWLQRHNS